MTDKAQEEAEVVNTEAEVETEGRSNSNNDDLDVFDDDEVAVAEEESEETEDEPVPEAKTEKGVKKEEPPASESKESGAKTVPLSVVQALRRENQALKAQQRLIEEAPDPVIDPKGFTKHITEGQNRTRLQERIDDSRDIALEAYPDYEVNEAHFMSLITTKDEATGKLKVTNQALLDEMNASRNPAKFAYEQGQKHARYLERSDDSYEEKVEKKVLAKVTALMKQKGSNIDFSQLLDLTNVAATSKNTNYEEEVVDSDRIDVFDD